MKQKMKPVLRVCLVGLAVGTVLALVSFLAGLLAGGMKAGLVWSRSLLLLCAGFLLLFGAIELLRHSNLPEGAFHFRPNVKTTRTPLFPELPNAVPALIIGVILVLLAQVPDWLLLGMNAPVP